MDNSEKDRIRGAVAVICRAERLLIIRRSQHVRAPGMLCFPGGGIEGSETESDALRRELQEELGVQAEPRRRLWQSVTPWQVELAWWQVELDENQILTPNPAEVAAIYWMTTEQIRAAPRMLESNRLFLEAYARGEFRLFSAVGR